MPLWFIIAMVVLNVISVMFFLAIHKNIQHVTAGHIKILGTGNIGLVKTRSLFMTRVLYLLAIFVLPIFFFIFA